jgi:hypothetical protein
MTIKQKDIKLLWGRSGNRCSMPDCRTELSEDSAAIGSGFTLGEAAHIVGEKENASRGKSVLSTEERNSYHNLILLCPTHHTKIDKNLYDWPIEKLHQIKSEHELWVRETLSGFEDVQVQASKLAVAHIIDMTVEDCRLLALASWTNRAFSFSPHWDVDFPDQLFNYLQKIRVVIWPEGFEELKDATLTLAILLCQAVETFLMHSEEKDGYLEVVKFYKEYGYNENYHKELKLYKEWLNTYYDLAVEATKGSNWFADTVRRDVNPLFFLKHGKFSLPRGSIADLTTYFNTPEFSDEEKKRLPESLM